MTELRLLNNLLLEVDVFGYDPAAKSGRARMAGSVVPGDLGVFKISEPTARVTTAASGAVVRRVDLALGTSPVPVTLEPTDLTAPFHIPAPPQPTASQPIPADSLPWLVGMGEWEPGQNRPQKVIVTREQFWRKSPASYSLPPRSFLMKSLQEVSGVTKTSSTSSEMQAQLSMSVSAGWGPFSATASAALSTTSQRTDTVTLREQVSREVTHYFTNDRDEAVVVCFWQLMDRIRLLKTGSDPQKGWLEVCVRAIDCGLVPLIPYSFDPAAARDPDPVDA